MDERSNRGDDTPHAEGSLSGFLKELQRRRVIRVGIVYVVSAWVIIQVAETTFPNLGLPGWTVTFVVLLCMLGFPIAIILSWAFRIEAEHADPNATTVEYVVPKSRGFDFLIIGALTIAVVILAYELYMRQDAQEPVAETLMDETAAPTQADPRAAQRPSIGVLPFLNLSDDKENEYFADGLAEEILNLLVRVRELDVAARTSSFFFKGRDVDVREVATQLGVSTVLEGSVRRQGDRIRVTAQLIEAGTGYHLWSETYDRQLDDVFAIQDDISRAVVTAVGAALSPESKRALDASPTDNVHAYEAYLKGRALMHASRTEKSLEVSQALFREAIELDPDFAGAHAGLCSNLLAIYRGTRTTEYFEAAEKSCLRGLTLDSGAGDVNTSLGQLYLYSGQYEKAEMEFRRAIALNGRDMEARFGLANTYERQGRSAEAEAVYKEAILVQPGFHRGYMRIGNFYYYAGRNAEAIAAYQQALALAPENSSLHVNLGSAYFLEGLFEQAAAAWNQSLELRPTVQGYMNVGSSYFFLERFEKAAEMYQKAIDTAPDDYEAWGALGDALWQLPDRKNEADAAYQRAIELAEKSYAINQSDAMLLGPLSNYYAHVGRTQDAERLVADALQLQPENVYVQYFAAVTFASLDDIARGREALDKALSLGYPRNLVASDAGLAKLLTDESS